jgi:RimJ/RimL family protein N-acetyltransferase
LRVIRKATAVDFDKWWDLRKRALRDHPDAFGSTYEDALARPLAVARDQFVTTSIAHDNALFIAFNGDGALVGTVGIYRETSPKERHRMGIWGVYIAPEARGRGLGLRLTTAAIEHARTIRGVLQIELTVASHNVPARRVYEQAGFRRYGRHPRGLMLDGTGIDEDLMVLMLDEDDANRLKGTDS